MQKILKLSAVSMLAIMTATGANAAGYTCEELIEYTSCNAGYYLGNCPDGYTYGESWCYDDAELYPDWECDDEYCLSEEERRSSCNDFGPFYGVGCFRNDVISDLNENFDESPYYQLALEELPEGAFISGGASSCAECLAGHSCPGGDKDSATMSPCAAGTYQPNKKQTSCISAPVGNYVANTGATGYTACAAGSYQPTTGQSSCLSCPAGSYCAGTGLSAVSGQCKAGTFASAGASECLTCPEHEYTNASGQTVSVPATTVPEIGAGSVAACIIDTDKTFTDIKGTYHFKENCAYDAVLYPSCEYFDTFAQHNNPNDYYCSLEDTNDGEGRYDESLYEEWMDTIDGACNDDADCIKNLRYNCSLYQSAYENADCEYNEDDEYVCTLDLGYGITCEIES